MFKRVSFLIAVSVVAVGITGCSRGLSPEMRGLALTDDEAHNNWRMTKNQNWRSFSDDLARTFYTDSPSRMTPYPVVTTGGMPH